MGQSRESMGIKAVDSKLVIRKQEASDFVVALAGNPNVGKSTVFNQLTGLKQHTGNWPGKTVTNAQGWFSFHGQGYVMVDVPGCYSLMAHSAEEEVARDFICFEHPDAVVVVCDATCLERNMNLVLQVMEAAPRVIVCVNLMDEAAKKKIEIDCGLLEERLKTPVIPTSARNRQGLEALCQSLETVLTDEAAHGRPMKYDEDIEALIAILEPAVAGCVEDECNVRWLCARLLDADESLFRSIREYLGFDVMKQQAVVDALFDARCKMEEKLLSGKQISDRIAASFVRQASAICQGAVAYEDRCYAGRDRLLDRLFTSRLTGFPIMFLVLLGIFWLTITGANYPSQLLSAVLFKIEDHLAQFFIWAGTPKPVYELVVYGAYRVLAWVVSVMLPPMAIFFPLFTLLEDFGYLPRVAFNLDQCFKRCCACGKQALTMCLGK